MVRSGLRGRPGAGRAPWLFWTAAATGWKKCPLNSSVRPTMRAPPCTTTPHPPARRRREPRSRERSRLPRRGRSSPAPAEASAAVGALPCGHGRRPRRDSAPQPCTGAATGTPGGRLGSNETRTASSICHAAGDQMLVRAAMNGPDLRRPTSGRGGRTRVRAAVERCHSTARWSPGQGTSDASDDTPGDRDLVECQAGSIDGSHVGPGHWLPGHDED